MHRVPAVVHAGGQDTQDAAGVREGGVPRVAAARSSARTTDEARPTARIVPAEHHPVFLPVHLFPIFRLPSLLWITTLVRTR